MESDGVEMEEEKLSGSGFWRKSRHNSNDDLEERAVSQFEFTAMATDETRKVFARRSEEAPGTYTSQDLCDALNLKKVFRTSILSQIKLLENRDLLLLEDRSNVRAKYGYDVGKQAYFQPEEALYLLESGKAEIICGHVSLSVQRARSLLLVSDRAEGLEKVKKCTHSEYMIYRTLTRMGYSVHRYNMELEITDATMTESPDRVAMEEDFTESVIEDYAELPQGQDEVIDLEPEDEGETENSLRRPSKRKLEAASSSDEEMEVYPEVYSKTSHLSNENDDTEYVGEPSAYTVDEADSDVEIVDEVIFTHGGVEIQEIAHSVGCLDDSFTDEPVASTSRGPPVSDVVVDLVSSDEEDDETKDFGRKIWSKFVPSSKLLFTMPPSKLVPKSIPCSDNVYEFDLKDKSDISDLELEFLVDEVSLNDDNYGFFSDPSSSNCGNSVKSWKEWRQNIFQEARDVMNKSLLASSDYITGESASEKLFLWPEEKEEAKLPTQVIRKIVFQMYGPIQIGFSRQKASSEKPAYYVLISRQDEPIPDFQVFGSSFNGVPILIAVVSDSGDNEVIFLTADRSPLNSLF